MNKEYLEAKVELCSKTAVKQLLNDDISEAIKNIDRANTAMVKLFNLTEGQGESE